MKKILKCAAVAMAFLVPAALTLTSGKKADALVFEQTAYDFGSITDSHDPVVHEYEFTNVTDEPVAVLSVSTGCGCTRPTYPTEPVRPGKKGKIKITFLPAGQRGEINKDIKVRYRSATARSSQRTTLLLKGYVEAE